MNRIAQLTADTIILLSCLVLSASVKRHWAETASETIWRGRYKNCDEGSLVILPPGVVGHDSLPPAPSRGILVSASDPGRTAEVTLDDARVISVYDEYDTPEYVSARAALDWELNNRKQEIILIETKDRTFHGLPATFVHYRTKPLSVVDELVVYRTPKNTGPIINHFMLKTTTQFFTRDRKLCLQGRDGFRTIPVPLGVCSND